MLLRSGGLRVLVGAVGVVVAACGGNRDRGPGGGGFDGGVPSDAASDVDGGDAAVPLDAAAPGDANDGGGGGCRIDLPMPGFDPLFATYTDPFTAEDFDAMAGWVEMIVEIMTVIGPMSSPVVACTTGSGAFRVEAEGTEQDGVDETRMVIAIGSGYTGAGTYTVGTAGGLAAEVFHSDVGGATARAETVCQVCVEPGERAGLYRCRDLEDTAGNRLNVLQAAFRCD